MKHSFYTKRDKPPGFYRTGLTRTHFREAMTGRGWLTIAQITGLVSGFISPTTAMRYTVLSHKMAHGPTEFRVATGRRLVVQNKLNELVRFKVIERKGTDPILFRLITGESLEKAQ